MNINITGHHIEVTPALREYVEDWADRAKVLTDWECRGLGGERLPASVEATVYRVALEALANVARHAHARRVSVLLERDVSLVRLTVEDDGRGFDVDAVAADDMIMDLGPRSLDALCAEIEKAGTIVWNGPLGVFEFDSFAAGTERLAKAIAASKAFSIAGGGDTLAAIAKFGIAKDVSYISTAGGAFLEFLEGKTLPAIEILEQRAAQG